MLIEKLRKAIKEYGINELNDIQLNSLRYIEEEKNCLIVAPTGSGKTEAAIIPALNLVLKRNFKPISIIYITPLRALNRDMLRRIKKLSSLVGLRVAVRHGDTSKMERVKQSKNAPDILVTTPETFQILFLGKNLRNWIKNVKFVIIDEVHELFQSKRGVQLSVAVERLKEIANFQTICLSATVKNVEQISKFFAGESEFEVVVSSNNKNYSLKVVKPELIDEDEKLAEKLFVDVEIASHLRFISNLTKKNSVLLFTNTRQTAEALALKLRKLTSVEVHHGSLSKEARLEAEKKFLNREIKILVCTSSMELGIDIGHIDLVVQYSSPRQVSKLIQRVGRSGHKRDKTSKGYILVQSFDDILESWIISDMAIKGEIENEVCHEKSLDTLANQIVGMALEYKKIEAHKVFRIVKRSYPFRKLRKEEFLEVCNFLKKHGIIWVDSKIDLTDSNLNFTIYVKKKTRSYFYDNVSMIPDEKRYDVLDIVSGKIIGSLDEIFVTTFKGEVFAMKGELWRIVDVGEKTKEKIKVEPVSAEGEIPSWVGEEIPVPYEVAVKVGELRDSIKKMIRVFGKEKTVELLSKRFKTNKKACEEVVNIIDKTEIVPSNKVITVEKGDGVVVNACFGHNVNETLGRILATLIAVRRGTSVSVEIDPYRIKIYPSTTSEVIDTLKNLKKLAIESGKEGIMWLAERSMLDTKLFQWKIVSTARKFGILSKNADITRMNLKKFAINLKDTPVYKEAVREMFTEKFDIDNLTSILGKLFEEIDVVETELSEISKVAKDQTFDLLIPSKPNSAILHVFKNRIEKELCILHCINCGCTLRMTVKNAVSSELKCIKCGSRLIACLNSRRNLKDFSKEKLLKIANLVMSYGSKAIYALNTYGIGVEVAVRVLSRYYRSDEEFFKTLLEAEKNYIRTKKFWSE